MNDYPATRSRRMRVMLVEDDFLLAETMRDMLEELSVEVVGPIGWLDEALALVEGSATALDAALLDINLHGQASYPIADALCMRNIRFIFFTGYSAGGVIERFRNHPRCEKPIRMAMLASALGL